MEKKLVITAAVSMSVGALVSWAITGDYEAAKARRGRNALRDVIDRQSRRFNDLSGALAAEERLAEVVDTASEKIVVETDEELVSPLEPISVPDEPVTDVETYVVPDGETPEETRSNLQNLIDQYTTDPDNASAFVEAVAPTLTPGYQAPFVISKAQYAWSDEDAEDFSKITLTYYPNDRVLLDEDESIMEDVDRVVGWRNLAQFGGVSEDPDTVFVRNNRLEIDYEVVKEEGSLPIHIKYGMDKDEFEVNKAAGVIKFRRDDVSD